MENKFCPESLLYFISLHVMNYVVGTLNYHKYVVGTLTVLWIMICAYGFIFGFIDLWYSTSYIDLSYSQAENKFEMNIPRRWDVAGRRTLASITLLRKRHVLASDLVFECISYANPQNGMVEALLPGSQPTSVWELYTDQDNFKTIKALLSTSSC